MNSKGTGINNEFVTCSVEVGAMDGVVKFQGKVKTPGQYEHMLVLAAQSIDRMTNYSGSGLPWPCPGYAFEGTRNMLMIGTDGAFEGSFQYPNSYYTYDGFTKVPPSIFIVLHSKEHGKEPDVIRIALPEDETLKVRSLTHRPMHNQGPIFYAAKEDLMGVPRTAEAAMLTLKEYKSKYGIA